MGADDGASRREKARQKGMRLRDLLADTRYDSQFRKDG